MGPPQNAAPKPKPGDRPPAPPVDLHAHVQAHAGHAHSQSQPAFGASSAPNGTPTLSISGPASPAPVHASNSGPIMAGSAPAVLSPLSLTAIAEREEKVLTFRRMPATPLTIDRLRGGSDSAGSTR